MVTATVPSKTANRPPIYAAALAAAVLGAVVSARLARAADPIVLPLVLVDASALAVPPSVPTPSPPPPVTWSSVLADVPVYPGMRLAFFELRAADVPAAAVALYDPAAPLPEPAVVVDWYTDRLSAYGWVRASQDAGGGRWTRPDDGGWLAVRYGTGTDGVLRLSLRRDAAGARAPGPTALVAAVPLPDGARRLRYDPSDLLAEELALDRPAPDTRLLLERRLAAAGWQESQVIAAGAMTYLRFERRGAALLVGVRATGPEASTAGLGEPTCAPAAGAAGGPVAAARSVYLAGVPVPEGVRLVGFERTTGDAGGQERWQGACLDVDVVMADYVGRLVEEGWSLRPERLERWPGRFGAAFAHRDGSPDLVVGALAGSGAQLVLTLQRGAAGCRVPQRASLLWPDVPVPWGADAWRLEGPTVDEWPLRETYRFPPALAASVAAWYRGELAETPWRFARLEPAGLGTAQVYGAAGEELLVGFDLGAAPAVHLSRRRVCASDQPVLPPAEGRPARWLAELLVYPGAEYDGFDAPDERYRVRCADTDVVANWYRVMLARGNWVLVSTEWPHDTDRRRLTFARPGEQGWPPERRTAWAEVTIERAWPYTFRVVLRRDPLGVIPLRAAR